MERHVFERMAEVDGQHWWFVARRRILAALIDRRVALPAAARVVEIGAGTGHNLAMLAPLGSLDATELDPLARDIASKRLGRPVREAALPDLAVLERDHYDLVALLDVLEHVVDDAGALAAIRDRLKPGGTLLLTVPANKWMWSAHDVAHHHHRRYQAREIRSLARGAGLEIDYLGGFNSLLFPLIAAVRLAGKLSGSESADDAMPGPTMNRLLGAIFALERHLVGRVSLPFGVSLVALLRRPS